MKADAIAARDLPSVCGKCGQKVHYDEMPDIKSTTVKHDAGNAGWPEVAAARVATLTLRQLQIMKLVLAGYPSKNIAVNLGISKRTVENHRASIMKKTYVKSVPALTLVGVAAGWFTVDEPRVEFRFRPLSPASASV